jgi:hypothetical protein
MDFYDKYNNWSDDQIFEILKHHKDYQNLAVEAAIKIAIERQLINSERDLFSPEFQNVRSNRSIFFPEIPDDFQRQKLADSIFRFLYVMSFLPLIFGFLKYAEGKQYFTFIGAGTGIIWFLLSFLLNRTHKKVIFIPLFLIIFTISIAIGRYLTSNSTFHFLDLVMLLIGTLLPVYLLLLLGRLIQSKSKSD